MRTPQWVLVLGGCAWVIVAAPLSAAAADQLFDLVIVHGRVMDPESNFDGVRNVGISHGKVGAISSGSLSGKATIDAQGLVVAPGFIDMHEHGQQPRNYQFQAHDGVTTSLELERGTADVDQWYAERDGKTLINYGVSIGHLPVRTQVLAHLDLKQGIETRLNAAQLAAEDAAAHREATSEELAEMKELMERGFSRGALAEGMGINYTPGASRPEILEMFRLAAKHGASVHVHLRYSGLIEPETGVAGLEEVLAAAAATGAALHVVHITSMGLKFTPLLIDMVAGARKSGLDVTTECYPYTAGSTRLQSAVFDQGWQEKYGISYRDLQWADTGERLTAETFAKYRKRGGFVVIHDIPAEAARAAVANPIVMIASDGMPITGPKIHPRGQGTFARVLGHYVREEHALDLMTALRKMTLMPAERLEKRAPVFHNKGRIRVGADADLALFDPQKVIDKATFESPLQYSEGIQYVLVNGVAVVRNGELVPGVFPGRPTRAPVQ